MNKKKLIIGHLVFALFAMVMSSNANAQDLSAGVGFKSYIAHYKINTSGMSDNHTYYYKEGKLAIETTMATMIFAGKTMYSIDLSSNTAYKMTVTLQNNTMHSPPQENLGALLGTEEIIGKLCEIYEYKSPAGNIQPIKTKIWVWKGKGLVLKSVSDFITMEATKVDIDVSIPDSKFKIPAGVKIMSLPNMGM